MGRVANFEQYTTKELLERLNDTTSREIIVLDSILHFKDGGIEKVEEIIGYMRRTYENPQKTEWREFEVRLRRAEIEDILARRAKRDRARARELK